MAVRAGPESDAAVVGELAPGEAVEVVELGPGPGAAPGAALHTQVRVEARPWGGAAPLRRRGPC